MQKLVNLLGLTIGGLRVARLVGRNKRRRPIWECVCSCGAVLQLNSEMLLRRAKREARSYGCGCTRRYTKDDIKRKLIENRRVNDNGCWIWTSTMTPEGYGRIGCIGLGKSQRDVHRLASHLWLGMDLESPAFVCHHCDNPGCFNPEHLFIGDNSANLKDCHDKDRHPRRMQQLSKTQCPYGHPYAGENLIVMKSGSRACKECMRRRCREYQERKRGISKSAPASLSA